MDRARSTTLEGEQQDDAAAARSTPRSESAADLVTRYAPNHGGIWEGLADHLVAVGELGGKSAAAFGAGKWGRLLGRWHDLGKASDAFQSYLRRSVAGESLHKIDHSTVAAQLAAEHGQPGRLIAPLLAGHHGGLPDAAAMNGVTGRLSKSVPTWQPQAEAHLPGLLDDEGLAEWSLPFDLPAIGADRGGFALATFARMLFSSLVDADSLVSERLEHPEREAIRQPRTVQEIGETFDEAVQAFADDAERPELNIIRAGILAACRAAAKGDRGFYSLTVPTGGGKTIASLAFALDHVRHHARDEQPMRGVVYAIPFTSIIDQTARVFCDLVGEDAVLEHHGQVLREPKEKVNETEKLHPLDLAAENFDHPLVVTTNVQLLESLFAAKRSRCRKLHQLAGRVLIFDEAQTLPVALLKPTLMMLRELVDRYGCTVVLCTATQPMLTKSARLPFGLPSVREIVADPSELA